MPDPDEMLRWNQQVALGSPLTADISEGHFKSSAAKISCNLGIREQRSEELLKTRLTNRAGTHHGRRIHRK